MACNKKAAIIAALKLFPKVFPFTYRGKSGTIVVKVYFTKIDTGG
jgi:hypothetical protein